MFLSFVFFVPFHFDFFESFCHSTCSDFYFVIFNIFVIHPVLDGMVCVYKGNDKKKKKKKSLQTWILKEKSDMKPKKNWSIFSALYQTHSGDFFCLFWNWDLKTRVSMMLKCNVCIAQCLLVGYYKSSDQSNKVVQFSTTEKCVHH